MYTPDLMPSNVHNLWLRSHKPNLTQVKKQTQDEESYQSTLHSYAPPLSSYSSARPGAVTFTRPSSSHMYSNCAGSDIIHNDIEQKLRQLRSIRTLGYSYLAPLGIGKTMETLDEEAEMKRQIEEQFQNEATTAENLLGEADLDQQQQQQQIPQPTTPQIPTSNEFQERPIQSPTVQFATPQRTEDTEAQVSEAINLDDEIPDAEENSYGNYNNSDDLEDDGNTFERQYDREFMVSEQYESQDVDEGEQIEQNRFEVSLREDQEQNNSHTVLNTSSTFGNISGHASSFNASGVIAESSFGEHPGDVSFNSSDLDMVID